jgi:hypothetical protein
VWFRFCWHPLALLRIPHPEPHHVAGSAIANKRQKVQPPALNRTEGGKQ